MSKITIRHTGASDYGQFTKALICAPPGTGKTLISSTWPKPFYLSAEGGLMSIADRNIPYANIRTITDLHTIKAALTNTKEQRESIFGFPIETVVLDTIDEIQRILIRERLEETGKDQIALGDWQWLADQMGAIVRGFRNLDLHVVFTCHLKEVNDSDTGRVSYKPQIQGGFCDQIAANVDLALLLKASSKVEVIDGKPERVVKRVLQTSADPTYEWIKDRSGKLPREMEVDFHTDFERINEAIFGGPTLDEGETSEITVALPELLPTLTQADAVIRPKRGRPSVAATANRAPAQPSVVPVQAPAAVTDRDGMPVRTVQPEALTEPTEAVAEIPVEAPKVSEPRTDGIEIRNPIDPDDPNRFMPAKSLKLNNKGHETHVYCQKCGDELESVVKAQLSQIRFRQIYCTPCFDNEKRSRSSQK